MLCSVTTSGTSKSFWTSKPPRAAYQVWECTTSAVTGSAAIASPTDSASSAGA